MIVFLTFVYIKIQGLNFLKNDLKCRKQFGLFGLLIGGDVSMYRDFNIYFIFGILVMILVMNFPFSYENNEYLLSLFSKTNCNNFKGDHYTDQRNHFRENIMHAEDSIKRGKYKEALLNLSSISQKGYYSLKIEQLKARVYLLLAIKECESNSYKIINNPNYTKSIELLSETLKRSTEDFSSYKLLSESFYIAKDYRKMKDIAVSACMNSKVNYADCKSISKLLLISGNTNEAVNICKTMKNEQRKNSYCAWVYKSLGNIYLSEGNEFKANNYFQDAYIMNSSAQNFKNIVKTRVNRDI